MEYRDLIFEAITLNSPVAIVTLDLEGKVDSCNPSFEKMFGYSYQEVLGNYLDLLISTHDTLYETSNYTNRTISHGETIRTTGKRRKKDKSLIDVDIQGIPIVIDGEKKGILTLYHDITDQVRAEKSSRDLYKTFVNIMDSIDADVYVADIQTHKVIFMNQHMCQSFGGDQVGQICYRVFRNQTKPCDVCTNNRLLDNSGNPVGEVVWEGQNPVTKRWYKNFDRAIDWGEGHYVRLEVATDITDIKEASQHYYHMATHDPLTDLPNRLFFMDKLTAVEKQAGLEQSQFAVAFLDFDNFKTINDQFGHSAGDQVLVEASRRMKLCLREQDIISRVSGDEFTFILPQLATKTIAAQIVDRIIKSVSMPYLISGNEVEITVSVGISLYPDNAYDPDILLQYADNAMYEIKKKGKNSFGFFGED